MKKKTLLIAGATGLIGRSLLKEPWEFEILTAGRIDFKMEDMDFAEKFSHADIIINFSGAPVIRRWTASNKKEILDSRVLTTRKLGLIMQHGEKKKRHYISASAIGIYSDSGEHNEESTVFGSGFMKDVVETWENESLLHKGPDTIVSLMRIGLVLSNKGGMMKKLLPVFRMGLGGRIGNGRQGFSWIHIRDIAGAVDHIMQESDGGIYNLVSPNPVNNMTFTKALADALKKPAFMRVPVFALKTLLGRGASAVSGGQKVIPERLLREGYKFQFPELEQALKDIVN